MGRQKEPNCASEEERHGTPGAVVTGSPEGMRDCSRKSRGCGRESKDTDGRTQRGQAGKAHSWYRLVMLQKAVGKGPENWLPCI